MKTVLVCGLKGGTGKSMISSFLSKYISEQGQDVVLIDADIDSPNISEIFKIKEDLIIEPERIEVNNVNEHLDVFSFGYYTKDKSISMSGDSYLQILLDLIKYGDFNVSKDDSICIIDCPAGASELFTGVLKSFKDSIIGSIIVGVPQNHNDIKRLSNILKFYGVDILGCIENMAYFECECGKRYDFSNDKFYKVLEDKNIKLYGSIPFSPEIKDSLRNDIDKIPDNIKNILEIVYLDIIEKETKKISFFDKVKDKSYKIIKRNISNIIVNSVLRINREINIRDIEKEGYGGNTVEMILVDNGEVLSQIYLRIKDGKLKVVKNPKRVDLTTIIEIDALISVAKGNSDIETAFYLGQISVYGPGGSIRAMSFFKNIWNVISDEVSNVIKSTIGG